MRPLRAFWILALATLLDRWAWSGYRAVIVRHLVADDWEPGLAIQANALVYSLICFLPLVIGLALTTLRREQAAVRVGSLLFSAGYFGLAFAAGAVSVVAGLLVLCVGRALVLNTLPALTARLSAENRHRNDLDVWMTRLYVFGNAGSFLGPILAGLLIDDTGGAAAVFVVSGVAALGCWLLLDRFARRRQEVVPTSTAAAETKVLPGGRGFYPVLAIGVVTLFSVVFWSGFEQKSNTLNLFAGRWVDLQVGPWTWKPEWFQSVNPLFVVALAPLFDLFWRTWDSRRNGRPVSPFAKLAAGLAFLGMGFWVLPLCRDTAGDGRMSWAALVLVYLLFTVGELLLEPIGQALVLKLAPAGLRSFFLAVWNVSTSFASALAAFYPTWFGGNIDNGFDPLWLGLGILMVTAGALLFGLSVILTERCRPLLFEQPAAQAKTPKSSVLEPVGV